MTKRPRAGRVVVVGSTNTDLVVHCARLPGPGATVLGGDLLTFAGGKGANQAVAAARAGAKVGFIGAFGDDDFGRQRRRDLEKEGVDCRGCVVKQGVPSGVALIAIGEGQGKAKAENLIVVAPGANMRLTPADVIKGMPKDLNDRDVVLCSLEVPNACVIAAFRQAWKSGCHLILNPAPMPTKALPREMLRYAEYLTPNEDEFAALTGERPKARVSPKLRAFFKKYLPARVDGGSMPRAMIVTRGAKGCLIVDPEGAVSVPAPKVKPVDTVGAGDCFNGALAAALTVNPCDRDGAVRFAVVAASLKVTRHGAQAGMPRRSEVLRKLA